MDTILLHPDFKDFLRLLNTHKVRYLLIGGYAVGYYGYPRATGDMDIWVQAEPENAEKLVLLLRDFGFASSDINTDIFLNSDQIVRMGIPPVRIEILTSVSGVEFDECYRNRSTVELNGVSVDIISFEHLKQNKRAAGRHKDLNDLENL